jgi:hypothetical protein
MNLNEYHGGIEQIRHELGMNTSLSNYPGLKKIKSKTETLSPYDVVFSATSDGDFPLTLIIRKSDLFLQGFISKQNKYYYFTNSTIKSFLGKTAVSLGFDSNYSSGLAYGAKDNLIVSFSSIDNAIKYLYNYEPARTPGGIDKTTLVLMILAVCEATRFKHLSNRIGNILDFMEPETKWGAYKNDLLNWGTYSNRALANIRDTNIQSKLALAL